MSNNKPDLNIVYINLKKRTDRRKQMEEMLGLYGLTASRFEAIETPNFGIYGCGLSHLAVLKQAKELKYKSVLILEDDFLFEVSPTELSKKLSHLQGLDADVCMLAYTDDTQTTYNDKFNRIISSTNAAAYVVFEHYYDKLIDLYEYAMPLLASTSNRCIYANDICWKELQAVDKWLCFNPRLGRQRPGYSDNVQKYTDYNS